jgi:hypothetical protein
MNTHMKLMQCANSDDSSQVTSTSEVCMCVVKGLLQNKYLYLKDDDCRLLIKYVELVKSILTSVC